MNNRYGVDIDYFEKNMQSILDRLNNYRPDELARSLARLSLVADSDVIFNEREFKGGGNNDK